MTLNWSGAKLHLGCGAKYLNGWINADGLPAPSVMGQTGKVDAVINVTRDLGLLPTETLAWVYTSHMIEHIAPDVLPEVLMHLYRSLRQGGKLTIATTDFEGIYKHRFASHENGDAWEVAIFGHADSTSPPIEMHRDCFSYSKLKRLLHAAGFETVRPWEYDEYPELKALNDFGYSNRMCSCLAEGIR